MKIKIENEHGYEALKNIKFPVIVNADYAETANNKANKYYVTIKEEEFKHLEGYEDVYGSTNEVKFYFRKDEYSMI